MPSVVQSDSVAGDASYSVDATPSPTTPSAIQSDIVARDTSAPSTAKQDCAIAGPATHLQRAQVGDDSTTSSDAKQSCFAVTILPYSAVFGAPSPQHATAPYGSHLLFCCAKDRRSGTRACGHRRNYTSGLPKFLTDQSKNLALLHLANPRRDVNSTRTRSLGSVPKQETAGHDGRAGGARGAERAALRGRHRHAALLLPAHPGAARARVARFHPGARRRVPRGAQRQLHGAGAVALRRVQVPQPPGAQALRPVPDAQGRGAGRRRQQEALGGIGQRRQLLARLAELAEDGAHRRDRGLLVLPGGRRHRRLLPPPEHGVFEEAEAAEQTEQAAISGQS
ncbi:hypothetical protein ON010_g17968 [Phytophthora cinnamomi]|nr:hypothetical protein ON010_g17968 [Phytophthora cinnamomi]